MICPLCHEEFQRPIVRTHPISGKTLPEPICRECAESITRGKPDARPVAAEPGRRFVKAVGEA